MWRPQWGASSHWSELLYDAVSAGALSGFNARGRARFRVPYNIRTGSGTDVLLIHLMHMGRLGTRGGRQESELYLSLANYLPTLVHRRSKSSETNQPPPRRSLPTSALRDTYLKANAGICSCRMMVIPRSYRVAFPFAGGERTPHPTPQTQSF